QRLKTPEIGAVESQQPALAMRQHRCDDVGVVDLSPTKRDPSAKTNQLVPDGRAVFEDLEITRENERGGSGFSRALSLCPCLRSGNDRDELAQNLAAYVKPLHRA